MARSIGLGGCASWPGREALPVVAVCTDVESNDPNAGWKAASEDDDLVALVDDSRSTFRNWGPRTTADGAIANGAAIRAMAGSLTDGRSSTGMAGIAWFWTRSGTTGFELLASGRSWTASPDFASPAASGAEFPVASGSFFVAVLVVDTATERACARAESSARIGDPGGNPVWVAFIGAVTDSRSLPTLAVDAGNGGGMATFGGVGGCDDRMASRTTAGIGTADSSTGITIGADIAGTTTSIFTTAAWVATGMAGLPCCTDTSSVESASMTGTVAAS